MAKLIGLVERGARSRRLLWAAGAVGLLAAAVLFGLAAGPGRPVIAVFGSVIVAVVILAVLKLQFELAVTSRDRFDRVVEAVENSGRVARRDLSDLERSHGDALRSMNDTVGELTAVSASATERRLEVERQMADLRGLVDSCSTEIREFHKLVESERTARIFASAGTRSTGRFPARVLLQVTVPRTSSTCMFDIVRSHPDVYVEPTTLIWEKLGLGGRRYPVALSDLPGSSTPIVTIRSVGVEIPNMGGGFSGVPDRATGNVAVEKLHPSFFDFDARGFAERLARLETRYNSRIDIVYQVRKPLDIMWSMAEYKMRDNTWSGSLNLDEIPGLVSQNLFALRSLLLLRPGLVIDFDEVTPEHPKMSELGALIDPTEDDEFIAQWLKDGFERSARSPDENTPFLGPRSKRHPDGPDGVWSTQQQTIGVCQHLYSEIPELS